MRLQPIPGLILACSFLLALTSGLAVESAQPRVLTVRVEGTITTATADLIREAIRNAETGGYEALVVLLNTPGGLLSATFNIIDAMEASKVPIIGYVYPSGARGWSAGTFILMASHIAAMAPYTVIGSAQPVSFSPFGETAPVQDEKTINALTAFIAERARMHGRNETAAKEFITKNLNLDDEQALRYKVIEVRASSVQELLAKVDGMAVRASGRDVTLRTSGSPIEEHQASFRVRFLELMGDPILASLALLIGLYALIFGISSPGYFAEILGAFLLIVGLIGLGFSISIGALLLLIIGAILMIAEAYTPGFGLLGGAGVIFVIVGSLLLVPFEPGRWLISHELYNAFLAALISASSVIGAFTLFMVYKVVKARRQRPVFRDVVGDSVYVVDELGPGKYGYVKYRGELWRATSTEHISPGSRAIIVGRDGFVLIAKPIEEAA